MDEDSGGCSEVSMARSSRLVASQQGSFLPPLLCTLLLLQLAAAFYSAAAQTVREASSATQLAAALADDSVQTIVVVADIITAHTLTVSSSVTIRGDRQQQPRRALRSGGGAALLSVVAGGDLRLQDLQFADFNLTEGGLAAIVNNAGTIGIVRCAFSRIFNPGIGDGSGAVALYNNGTAVLDTSDFLHSGADPHALVGIVNHVAGSLNVTGCNFTGNTRRAILTTSSGPLFLNASRFTGNTDINSGAGVYVVQGLTTTIEGCNFTRNEAGARGAGVSVEQGAVAVQACRFTRNKATHEGGALHADTDGTLDLSSSHFIRNSATDAGGALSCYSSRTAVMSGCTFRQNSASEGGAISTDSTMILKDCMFTQNNASVMGGAFAWAGGITTFVRCNFESNACNGNACVGGALSLNDESHIQESTFRLNQATSNGGAIHYRDSTSSIINATFVNNTAENGGAIFVDSSALPLSTANITNATFVNNTAEAGAALMALSSTNVSVAASNFTANHAALDGGAVYSEGSIILRDTELSRNAARRFGGGICNAGKTGVLRVQRSRFSRNNASRGGAIANQAVAALTNCSFFQDSASVSGGAVWISSGTYIERGILTLQNETGVPSHTVTYTGCNVTEATATVSGGGVFVETGGLIVAGSRFENCSSQDGGAIFLGGAGTRYPKICAAWETSSITGSTFISNNVSGSGGAISIGGRFCDSAANITISSSVFKLNLAENDGGGVYVACGPAGVCAAFHSSAFDNNTAVGGGGGAILSTLAPIVTCSGRRMAEGCSTWTGNQAINGYGPTLATNASSMNWTAEFQLAADGVHSGQPSGRPLPNITVSIIDAYGQVMTGTGPLAFYVEYNASSGRLDGRTTAVALRGVATFGDLAIVCEPGVRSLKLRSLSFPSLAPVVINVTIRPCEQGEVRNSDNTLCTLCERPSFSWDATNTTCLDCPDGADCLGGSVVIPIAGYWHSAERSLQFHACPNRHACAYYNRSTILENVLRNKSWEQVQQCADGYTGNLCGVCRDGWESSGGISNFQCKKCSSRLVNALAYTGISLITLVAMFLITRAALTTELDDTPDEDGRLPLEQAIQAMCKMIVTYIQVTSIAFGVSFNFPGFINTAVAILSSASSIQNGISLYCLMDNSGTLNKYYQLVLMYALLPIAGILAPAGIWLLVYCFAQLRHYGKANPPELRKYIRGFVVTFIVVEFFLWPAVTQQLLSLFACRKIDLVGIPDAQAVGTYWDQHINDRCYAGTHLTMVLAVGIPGIVLFGLGLPIGAYVLLWQRRQRLESEVTVKYCGFLYTGYKRSTFYWEFIVTLEKLALILVGVFLGVLSTQHQVLIALAVAVMCMALNVYAAPYSCAILNNMQTLAWSGNCLLLYVAWLLFLPLTSATSILLSITFALSCFGTVLLFLTLMLSEVYLAYQKKRRLHGDQARNSRHLSDAVTCETLQDAFGPVVGSILFNVRVAYALGKHTVVTVRWVGRKVSSRSSRASLSTRRLPSVSGLDHSASSIKHQVALSS